MSLLPWKRRESPQLIAVTGSTAKTSTAHLLAHLLSSSDHKVGLVSSLGVFIDDNLISPKGGFSVDTAKPREVDRALKSIKSQGVSHIIIELTDTLLSQGIVKSLEFDCVLLSNVIKDPSFYAVRGDFSSYADQYFAAVSHLKSEGLAVLNADDSDVVSWLNSRAAELAQPVYASWCSLSQVDELQQAISGARFKFAGSFLSTRLSGKHSLVHVLQAVQVAAKYCGADQIDRALARYKGVAGRKQLMELAGRSVIVDSAKSPPVIENLLREVSELCQPEQRLLIMMGADRSIGNDLKRIILPAAEFADMVVLAAQDPGDELVANINSEIVEVAELHGMAVVERLTAHDEYEAIGITNLRQKVDRVFENKDKPIVAFDASSPSSRYDAIEFILNYSKPGDVVVLLGKGDDAVIDFGSDALYEWDEAGIAREVAATLTVA